MAVVKLHSLVFCFFFLATSVGGIQWGQAEQASQPLMTVSSSGMYGQFQTTQQYQPQQAVTPGSEAMVYYQQPQVCSANYLTRYTLTSVCIFSILSSIHVLRY